MNLDQVRLMRNIKALSALNRLREIVDVKSDEIGFFSTGRIGDNVYLFLLSKAIKDHYNVSRLKLVIPKKLKEIAQLWPIDSIFAIDDEVLELICFSEVGHIYGLQRAQRGRLNCAHPGTIEKLSGIDGLNFLTLVKYQLGLSRCAALVGPSEPPTSIYEKINGMFPKELLDRSIVVSFESKAVKFEPLEKRKLVSIVLDYALRNNMFILFNEHEWYETAKRLYEKDIDHFFSLKGLSLLELFVVTKLCGRAFLVRSGLADLLALSGAKTVVCYPSSLCTAYSLNIPYSFHFSMVELTQINPQILETNLQLVFSTLEYLC